jgi:hypothetical protein
MADAGWLAGDDPESSSRPAPIPPRPSPTSHESYEVEGPVDPINAPEPIALPRAPLPAREDRPTSQREVDPAEAVPQVWTRGAEWGTDLLRIAGVLLGTIALVWLVFDVANSTLWLLLLLIGLVATVVLSYPLVITLERPVRVTPEQAVRDYYGALAHHVPHLRRMWLLLSAAGRSSGEYGSFEGFRRYWKRRLAELRGGKVPASTPLVFEITEFQSDRSADKRTATARFQVEVSARGRRAHGPLATIPVSCTLVRGPDNQWYLDRGTLPGA